MFTGEATAEIQLLGARAAKVQSWAARVQSCAAISAASGEAYESDYHQILGCAGGCGFHPAATCFVG